MALKPCKVCGWTIITGGNFCPNCGKKRSSSLRAKILIGMLILVGLAVISNLANTGGQTTSTSTASAVQTAPTTTLADLNLKFTWHRGGFDSVMLANFAVRNDGPTAAKDLEITCTHSANSGTVIDSNTRTVYEIVPAHGTKRMREFSMGLIHSQAAVSNCRIVDFKAVE